MRTVDPELWYTKVRKPVPAGAILRFGSYQASNFEIRLRSSFIAAMKDLGRNSSLSGVRLVQHSHQPLRLIYTCLVLVLVVSSVLVVLIDVNIFKQEPPLVVNQLTPQRPLDEIDFPAVAICSYNIISRASLLAYATHLAAIDKNGTFTLTQIEHNLLAFGGLVTLTQEPFDLHFMKFLADIDRETNITNIMLKLAPSCDAMLIRCAWQARVVPCKLLFGTRLTGNGFCCVMNSRYTLKDTKMRARRVNSFGQDSGLMVAVKENLHDVAYLRRPYHDVEVTLFDGHKYPLTESSGVHSYPVQRDASVHLKIRTQKQYLAHHLQFFTENWRGCFTTSEGNTRSEAACILECRREATLALCACVPYTYQPESNQKVCSPEHLTCLSKHREKLSYYNPGADAHASLDNEKSNGVKCLHCRPDCARLVYTASAIQLPHQLAPYRKFFIEKPLSGVDLTNSTIIRIFYGSKEDQVLYLLDTYLRYSENIAFLGGQWVLLCGASLLTAWEVLYFCSIRWGHHYVHRQTPSEQAAS